jgi:phosphopantetheinyl transferase (holo-ACP synthase)
MDETERVVFEAQSAALSSRIFAGRGCSRCGIRIVSRPREDGRASSWHDTAVTILRPDGTLEELPIAHDERQAPYVVGDGSGGESRLMVSLTDENDLLGVAWAEPLPDSAVMGVGLDIASTSDFGMDERGDRFVRLLFTQAEQEEAERTHPENVPIGRAFVFSAKEAAFKAASQALRAWHLEHEEKVPFEVRNFSLQTDGTEALSEKRAGTFEKLGIGSIVVEHVALADAVATCALALRKRG